MKFVHFVCAIFIFIFIFAATSLSLFAQTPAKLSFEVASIKPNSPITSIDLASGKPLPLIGMAINAVRVDIFHMTLRDLLMQAYTLKQYQIVGPDWMSSQQYEIHAKLPEGSSKEQIPQMLQTLLEERLKIVAHRENKETPVYALIVSKDGHKLKKAVTDQKPPTHAEDHSDAPAVNSSGDNDKNISDIVMPFFSKETGQGSMSMNIISHGMIYNFSSVEMSQLSTFLSKYLDRPVVDMTDLKDFYQLSLQIPSMFSTGKIQAPNMGPALVPSPNGSAPGTSGSRVSDLSDGHIFKDIQKLGLKLESRKVPIKTLIIDHIEKNPVED
jgi:uncharacterized protein (TIGR03435 family)